MLILSPGPANISERVRLALANPDIGHRESEFSELLQETRSLLLEISGVSEGYSCAVMSGSGTTGIEASITSLSDATKGVLIISNGVYGERAAQIAEVFGIPYTLAKYEWTLPLATEEIEGLIRETTHDTVYLIHHETTTGILNPLQQIAAVAKREGKWVLVDAVSSIGGEELDLSGWGVDLIIGSANKCIRGVPGVAFVVVSNDFLQMISKRRRVAFSTDLVSTLRQEEQGETPFTPPVQTLYGLREALRELVEEGVETRRTHYQSVANILRDGLSSQELTLLVPREHLSNTMTSVMLPEGLSYSDLHDPLKEMGYVIYKSQGYLSQTTFRLGTVGLISLNNIRGFLSALAQVLDREGSRLRSAIRESK